jgi:uncharacterized protein YueI
MEQLNSGENLKRSDIYRETWQQWAEKTDLEKALAVGSQGSPELREEERKLYLDEFPEDVILVLSLREAEKTESLSQVAEALTKPEAKAIILRGGVSPEAEARYFKLAQKHNRRCTVRHDPEFRGEAALIVIRD